MKRDMPPVHPGLILLEDFLKPMGITQHRLAKFFGTDAQSWLNLQTHYDLTIAESKMSDQLMKLMPWNRAA
jgi:plasmid maintenance system antidote protein VapI